PDDDLRQQRRRQAGQRDEEPADVIAVNVTVVVGEDGRLVRREDEPVAEGQHQVVTREAEGGQRPSAAMRPRSCQPAATAKATANTARISSTTLLPWPIMLSLPSLVQNWAPISAMACKNWGWRSAKKPSTGRPSRILTPL